MWRIPASTDSRSSTRQLEAGQPPAALDAEQVRARRLALQAALQHRVDLVLRARARVHQLLAARQPATQHAAALIGHPHRLQLARPQQPRQRARVQPVGLRARLRDPGVIRADHDHPLDVRLEDPRDLPAAARHLQRHPIRPHQALAPAASGPPACSAPDRRSGPDRPHRSRPRRSHGEHPGRSLDRPTSPTPSSPPHNAVDTQRENQRDNDTDRYVLAAQSRQVAGAAERKARARSPSRKPAYPPAFSQQKPLSRIARRYGRTQTEPPRSSFMPRNGAARQLDRPVVEHCRIEADALATERSALTVASRPSRARAGWKRETATDASRVTVEQHPCLSRQRPCGLPPKPTVASSSLIRSRAGPSPVRPPGLRPLKRIIAKLAMGHPSASRRQVSYRWNWPNEVEKDDARWIKGRTAAVASGLKTRGSRQLGPFSPQRIS